MGSIVEDDSSLVVVGSSAGGIEALERLVAALPEDFGAPIVIAQHADPNVRSHLAEILARSTRLRVVALDDSDDQLAPGTIYVAPAGKNLTIDGTKVSGKAPSRGHPIPSIDALFITAAENYGDRVIALILTGMGTDGVAGVRAVKERGGTVLVQEPASAAFPALPAAIPLTHIDHTAKLESLASLVTVLAASHGRGGISDPDVLSGFLNQLRARTGIDFRQYKPPTIVRRLSRLMAAAGCETVAHYLRYLGTNPEAYQRLVGTFLIKVTEFFRDPPLFKTLGDTILPELVDHARKNRTELRFWSAGCATGEEAYSLAIAVAELLGDDVETIPVRIFATDLDTDAIAFARRGIYPASALKEVPAELLARYFTRVGDAFQVKKRIRDFTVFGEYDLGQRAPFPRIDLVLCRNVLIYFTKELQQRTLALFAFALRVGGYLVLGKSETTSPLPEYFAPLQHGVRIFRRQGERLLIPAPATVNGGAPLVRGTGRRAAAIGATGPRRSPPDGLAARWSIVDRLGGFLFESAIGVVVVDRHYDILTINQAARAMLGIHGQGIGEDLIHLAQVPSLELKAALDNAFRNEMPGDGCELEVQDLATGGTRFLQIACSPDRTENKDGRIKGVFMLVVDVTKSVTRRRQTEAESQRNEETSHRLTVQNAELIERQRALIEANTELTSFNADLRSANEHLLISAEEAEASAEEVETLNEEMQATSEELETLNEELQATVEELNTTNEELAARGNDLERTAAERERRLEISEKRIAALEALVESLPLAACLIDESATVAATSGEYGRLAERNAGRVPTLGETWTATAKTMELDDEAGSRRAYGVRRITLSDQSSTLLLLQSG